MDDGKEGDPVTRTYYSYSTDSYMPYCGMEGKIGIPVRSSRDLVHFRYEGTVLSEAAVAQGRDNGVYPPTRSFWAPYAEYVKGEYRLYYAATRAFGSSESRIWLAAAENTPAGWEIVRFIENGNRIAVSSELNPREAGELIKNGVFHRCWDFENSRPVMTVTGFDRDGYAFWGKAH